MNNLTKIAKHFRTDMIATNGDLPHYYEFGFMHKIWDMENAPDDMAERVKSMKWDGYTVSALYLDGELIICIGQGDGVFGPKVTDAIEGIIPATISMKGIVQITGEVIAGNGIPDDAFSAIYESLDVELSFIAFDVFPHGYELWSEAVDSLDAEGFKTVRNTEDDHPKDGEVWRVNNMEAYAKSKMGLLAYKFGER